MKNTILPCVAACLVLFLAGCLPIYEHHGANLASLDTTKIEPGKTPATLLIQKFGKPMDDDPQPDGNRLLFWSDSRKQGWLIFFIIPHFQISNQHFQVIVNKDGLVIRCYKFPLDVPFSM